MSLAGRPGSRPPADRHQAWLRSLHARCPGPVKWLYSKPGVLSGLPGPQIRVSRSPSQPSAARVKCGLARDRAGAGPRDSPLARVAAHTRRSPAWVPFPNPAAQLRLWLLRPWAWRRIRRLGKLGLSTGRERTAFPCLQDQPRARAGSWR